MLSDAKRGVLIYSIESEFELVIAEFDSTPATSWFQHSHSYNEKMSVVWDGVDDGGKWSNLLTCLRRVHDDKFIGLRLEEHAPLSERQATRGQVCRLFDQLDILEEMPGDKVRRVLETHREAVVVHGRGGVLGSDDKKS